MTAKTPIILLLLLVLMTACGKKGPVLPKLLALPAAPSDLTIEQRGSRFLLAWDIPRLNQDGSPFEPQLFRILRMHYQPADECADCRSDYSLAGEIDLNYPPGFRRSGERLFWWDDAPQAGYAYRYQVLATTANGRAGAPAQAQRLFVTPPLPPQNPQATGLDQLVRLRWERPSDLAGELIGFTVYRWEPDTAMPVQPINDQPIAALTYDDFAVENGRIYLYAVSTVTEMQGQLTQSLPTEPVSAAPLVGE